jgi:hypothetical protein
MLYVSLPVLGMGSDQLDHLNQLSLLATSLDPSDSQSVIMNLLSLRLCGYVGRRKRNAYRKAT